MKTVSVYLSDSILSRVARIAIRERRTRSAMIQILLSDAVDKWEADYAKDERAEENPED